MRTLQAVPETQHLFHTTACFVELSFPLTTRRIRIEALLSSLGNRELAFDGVQLTFVTRRGFLFYRMFMQCIWALVT